MVTERADIVVYSGKEAEFESAMHRGCSLLANAAGCDSVALLRCVERPSRYFLRIEWQSIEAHQVFTKTPEFQIFRDIAGPYFSERPVMEHFTLVHTTG